MLAAFTSQPDRRVYAIIKDYWTRAFSAGNTWTIRTSDGQPFKNADAFWRHVVHDGFIHGTAIADGGPATPFVAAAPAAGVAATAAAAAAAAGATRTTTVTTGAPPVTPPPVSPPVPVPTPVPAQAAPAAAAAQGGLELIFRPDPTVWDGRFSNNGWLQELPKPLTKVAWDATAWINPNLANERGLQDGDVIELKYRGNTARMPIFRVPGHPRQSVTVFFGYGRRMAGNVGNATKEAELFNAYLLRTSDAPWFGGGLEITKTGERYLIATTQEHHLMEDRAPLRVATLEQYTKEPAVIKEMREAPPKTLTMYPDYAYEGYKWGMAIDLSSCTGCSACTIACVAENNIPVVGKEQVSVGREMHWIRVDHYFAGHDFDNAVESYHQPVPCMTGGQWGLVSRRVCEAAARNLPFVALMFVPVLLGLPRLYTWAVPGAAATDHVINMKSPYLNVPFFVGRAVLFFAVWVLGSWLLNAWSARQDRGEVAVHPSDTRRFRVVSAPGLLIYVVTMPANQPALIRGAGGSVMGRERTGMGNPVAAAD